MDFVIAMDIYKNYIKWQNFMISKLDLEFHMRIFQELYWSIIASEQIFYTLIRNTITLRCVR